jgi:hypothetical protein
MSVRSNNDFATILSASSPGSTASSSPVQTNPYGSGVKLQVNCSPFTSGSFTVTISGIINGVAYTILTSAALSSAAVTILTVYPGLVAAANVTVNDVLPRQWQVTITPTSLVGVVNIAASVIV